MSLLLGIDFGTSYLKAGVFDTAGTLRGLGRVRLDAAVTDSRVELAPQNFWGLVRGAVEVALQQAGAGARDIAGLSYASQANTFIALDAAEKPLTPLIVWTDHRAEVEAADAAFSATEAFHRTVGFRGIAPGSAVTKWRWLQRSEPALWQRVGRLLTLSDYVTWCLTGEYAGDASTASLLGLYDLGRGDWWPMALAHFGVERRQLVTQRRPGARCGSTQARAAELLGLPGGIPFAVGALDHHAAAIGAGVDVFAEASLSTGTVLAALAIVENVRPLDGCLHGPHSDGRRFYRLAFEAAGAGELEEFQRRNAPERTVAELVAEALTPPSDSLRAQLVRAMLERIATAQQRLLEQLSPGRPLRVVATTGGGARSAEWRAFTRATLRRELFAPANPECACLGAAIFAAAVAGVYDSIPGAARAMVQSQRGAAR